LFLLKKKLLPTQPEEEGNRFFQHAGYNFHNDAFPLPIITQREPKLKIGPIYRASLLRKTDHKLFSATLLPAHP
jgi:hypothetical protein